ncbi:hypothetical protein NBT05_03435 [Aquimarina sp. ERC-38]|uniref:hypothetical protein n=1 Tax=Aquimarina sp. ERC-38 TaxID=2949996 RepID=UPI0022478F72|nr:hypothetical protein [Aquimarina sp. ERC-38]UZO81533.1 hypothetical protein NBT05_03435 [Aquimarina sp. ERC-38]
MKKVLLITFCALLIFIMCQSEKESKNQEENSDVIANIKKQNFNSKCELHILDRKDNNLNISILLDLSDRIELPQQQAKDSAYILSIAKAFNNHVLRKKLVLLYDKMEVYFEPAPTNPTINQLAEELKVSYVKGVSKDKWIPETIKRYGTLPGQIYAQSRAIAKTEGYSGSDIWGFFKNHVKDYCMEACNRNILVILTDGYLYDKAGLKKEGNLTSYLTPQSLTKLKLNKSDWKTEIKDRGLGFIPATQGLEDLEVLVLGIQSQNSNHPYAQEIIENYWETWLTQMNVKRFKIKSADLPSHIEKVIMNFISNKN